VIPFSFAIVIVVFALLLLGFIAKIYTLGMISAMGLIVIGIFSAINGFESINNLLTQSLSVILIAVGAYVFIGGSLQQIQEATNG
jgi:energy-coupling factor transporter transmembrane protein EcfT|tara:strand:+ start:9765 stop:10019 length:255 start_codon:yes stop_codon:yes gene_type:complete